MQKSKKQKNLLSALVAGVLLSQMSVVAYGAEQEAEYSLDQMVVTANRIVQTVASTPADVTVITADQIEKKGARTLADALEGVSGVSVVKYGGLGEKAIPYILGSDRVIVLKDGNRLNLPQGIANGAAGVDLNTVMVTDNIEKIEVVRGGGSVMYGADAVGGIINIITKKGVNTTKTLVNAGGGSNSTSRFVISNQGSENGWHWYLNGAQDKTDGQRPNSEHTGKNVAVRIDKELSDKENLSLTFDYYGSHEGMPGKMQQDRVTRSYVGGTSTSLTDYSNILRHNWSAIYTQKQDNGDSTVRYSNNDQIYSGNNYGDFRHQNKVQAFEYQQNIQSSEKHLLTWGSEYRNEKVVSTGQGGIEHTRNSKSLFLQDKYKMNKHLDMTTGLRYDDNSQYGTNWLPRVAFNYQADQNTSYFVSCGKVVKAPNFDDLYWEDPYMKGNPNLKPEKGWTLETGVKKKFDNNNEASLSFFEQHLNDAIRWKDDYSTTENLDQLKTQGINLSYTSKLSPNVSADLGYTYLDSRKNNNEHLNTVPYNSFNIGLNIKQGKLNQRLSGYYVGNKGVNTTAVGSHFVLDTNITYDITKEQSLYLNIANVFDKKYQSIAGYPAQERSIFFGMKQSL